MIRRKQPPVEAEQDQPKGFDDFELRLGDVMRGERATLGKSLLDVQRELKIKATYIAAIENTDPSAFETPGFVAGYVRSYARYLGLDPEWAYARFCAEGDFTTVNGMEAKARPRSDAPRETAARRDTKDPLADPNASFVPRGEALFSRIEPGAVGSSLVLLALIGALGFGGWSVLREIQRVNLAPVDEAPGVLAEMDPLAGLATGPQAGQGSAAAPAEEALERLYRPQALDVPVMVARDGPIATLVPDSVGALADAAAPEPGATLARAETQAPDPLPSVDKPVQVVEEDPLPEVAIFATRPAWVRVSMPDGTILFEKILDAGTSYVLPRTEEVPLLRAGNSGAVYFAVNGKAYGPAAPGAQVVKNVQLASAALEGAYQPVDPDAEPAVATMVAELRSQWRETGE